MSWIGKMPVFWLAFARAFGIGAPLFVPFAHSPSTH
jgi:hypothetical protein